MASAYTRLQIVNDALALSGRSQELRSNCNQWLNYALRHVGLTFRFPELRKVGTPQTLALGQFTSPLPLDFGLGMEKEGMIFGADSRPLAEYSFVDFAANNGFPISPSTTGRPWFYMVDKNAGVFHFGNTADQPYPFTPVYFITPPLPALDPTGDSSTVWLSDDILAVNLLVQQIYRFTADSREQAQDQRVERMLIDWKRQQVEIGGTSRVSLSPNRFKTTRFSGNYGP